MRTTCDVCDEGCAFYIVERRLQDDLCQRWLCEQHARPLLEHAALSYGEPDGRPLFGSPHECIAHSVAMLAMTLADERCVVYLDRVGETGTTVCIIGQVEARGVANALLRLRADHGCEPPSTYGAMSNIIRAFGGTLASVLVDDFDPAERRYHAKLYVTTDRREGPTLVTVRPSDAIALALESDVPIYIVSSVIMQAEEARKQYERGP